MLLFGHPFIASKNFYHISDIDAIVHTPPNATLYLEFSEENLDIIGYLQENQLSFALEVKNIKELIYAHAFTAAYIVLNKPLAKTAQEIAENYLFDAKILVHATHTNEIEEFALLGIDGVIFSDAIIKINS